MVFVFVFSISEQKDLYPVPVTLNVKNTVLTSFSLYVLWYVFQILQESLQEKNDSSVHVRQKKSLNWIKHIINTINYCSKNSPDDKTLIWFCDSQRKTSDWHVVQWRCDWWICYDQHQWCGESAGVCVSCECGFSFLQTHTKMSFIWGYLAQISLAGCSLNSKPHFLSLMLTKAAFVLLKIQ